MDLSRIVITNRIVAFQRLNAIDQHWHKEALFQCIRQCEGGPTPHRCRTSRRRVDIVRAITFSPMTSDTTIAHAATLRRARDRWLLIGVQTRPSRGLLTESAGPVGKPELTRSRAARRASVDLPLSPESTGSRKLANSATNKKCRRRGRDRRNFDYARSAAGL